MNNTCRIKVIAFIFSFSFFLNLTYPFQDSLLTRDTPPKFNQDVIVASIGPTNITAEEFYYSYEFGPAFIKRRTDSKERHLNYMINEKLLALDGYGREIDKNKNISLIIKDFEGDIASEEMFKEDILNKIEIGEEEIDTMITQRQLELEIQWLYVESNEERISIESQLAIGVPFDSLYQLQFKDSVYLNERSMKINRFQLGKKNPEFVEIIDTLPVGQVSEPFKAFDGWYFFKLNNISQNIILTDSDLLRVHQESVNALKKKKMDKMSDLYVHHMFLEQNPTIRRNGFNILRSYIGAYVLPQEKYNEFELSEKLESALKELGATKDNINQVSLIEFENGIVNLEEFIFWYRNRSQYIKFNKESLSTYSKNLENLIWRMLRDKLLSEEALRRGFDQTESFKKQSGWWKDKIVYSSVRNEIIESVALKIDEINIENRTDEYDKDISEKKRIEIMRKFLTKLNELKINYQININHKVLNRIPVSDENNPKAVDFYTVKKGSLIPRPAYPTIDFEWINWE